MRLRIAALIFLLAGPGAAGPARADGEAFTDWPAFAAAFAHWSLDSTRVAEVGSLMLERDAGTIVLEQGRLAMAMPIGGRRVAAQFVGRGTILYAPRPAIEREQLHRFYGARTLRRTFERLTLVFADSTARELADLSFHTDTLGKLNAAWADAQLYHTAGRLKFVRPLALAQMLVDGEDNGLFYAIATDVHNREPVFFSIDPNFTERVRLERRPENDRFGLVRFFNRETVCQDFAAGDPDTLRRDMWPAYEAVHYAIDARLDERLELRARADLDIVAHRRARAWLGLLLPDHLLVDSVTAAGRRPVFHQERENPVVWVHLDRAIEAESLATISVHYHGVCFERDQNWLSLKFTTSWYPRPWYPADATWDLTFHHPAEYQLVAAGERLTTTAEGRDIRSTWRVRHPVPWASFDVNFLRGQYLTGDSLPPLTVWTHHVDHAGRIDSLDVATLAGARDDDHRVARDVVRCLQFFRTTLGEPLAPRFEVVETSSKSYEGYPGLVHMMRAGEEREAGAATAPDVIRAHEISHQWFGLGVAPATYHDAWLSEGFADFCSIWYLQASRRDSKSYFDVLASWRERLLGNRRFVLGAGQEAGPVWLGPRTNSSATPADYDLIVYAKGGWVLHMLRDYLLDERDPGEERFRGLLRDYYQSFVGRRAFTEDFRVAVERSAGEDMGWFFNQWVYGTDLPVYQFRWQADPTPEGEWRITGHIDQSGVPGTFRMPVLLRVEFADGAYSRQRVWVTGTGTDFTLPASAKKPLEVRFNDLESVLYEVRK